MKTSAEMAQSLLQRRDAFLVRRRKIRKTVLSIATAACAFVLVAAVGVGLWQGGVFGSEKLPVEAPNEDTITKPTSLAEAKDAIAQGRYEDAYRYLLTDSSAEAKALLEGFSYVPMEKTEGGDGERHPSEHLVVDGKGNLLSQPVIYGIPDFDADMMTDGWVNPDTKEATHEEYTYDDSGRILTMAMVYVNGETECREVYAYTYDTAGNMVKREHISIGVIRQTWVYTYDEKGRCIKEESGGEGYHSTTITYTYNEADQLLLCYETHEGSDSWTKKEYAYDANGNLVKDALLTSNGSGWTYEYTYDANGVQTSYSHTLPDNPNHWQKWHMEGNKKISERLEAEGNNYSKSISIDGKTIYGYFRRGRYATETEYTYDENGNRLTRLSWEEGSCEYTVYTYDDHNNLLKETLYTVTDRKRPEETATLYKVKEANTYVYDDDGRILQQEHTDEEGSVTKTEYNYDQAGRILTHKNVYDDNTWDSITRTYHENGNVMSTAQIRRDGSWQKETFDPEGRRLSVEDSDGQKYIYEWSLCYYTQNMTEQQRNDLAQLRHNADVTTGDDSMYIDSNE